jgi:pyruvate/2-oxoglutarate dehydrogenase complex dihydrolipoamide dehydrogenase (E3) component
VDVFLGAGRFVGGDAVEVGGERLRYARAVIATGGRAAVPEIRGLGEVGYLTNETLFGLGERPGRLGVVGAGPVGCEMAQAFARFGSEVVLMEAADGVLPREDADAAVLVERALERDGVRVWCGVRDLEVGKDGGGIRVRARVGSGGGGGEREVVVDRLLIAAGRRPNVEGMGLEDAGVVVDRRGVVVDDGLRTTNPRVYACGDVCSPRPFTHAADFQARLVVRNALFPGRARVGTLEIPWCTYTSPEVAGIGMGAREAAERGVAVDTYTQEFSGVDRAVLDGEAEGFVRVHVRCGTDRIVGATVVGANAGDLIGEIAVAMKAGAGLGLVGGAIHPYPTRAEAIRRTGDAYQRTRLKPWVKAMLGRWLAWQRR